MNEYERPIYSFLLVLLHDPEAALDCAQDTFLRAYENLRKGNPVKPAWLYKVARNRAMDQYRRNRHVQSGMETLERVAVYERTEESIAMNSVLAQLSPMDREVLYLFDVAGYKTDEIGSILGVRGPAVRQSLSRARARFPDPYGAQR